MVYSMNVLVLFVSLPDILTVCIPSWVRTNCTACTNKHTHTHTHTHDNESNRMDLKYCSAYVFFSRSIYTINKSINIVLFRTTTTTTTTADRFRLIDRSNENRPMISWSYERKETLKTMVHLPSGISGAVGYYLFIGSQSILHTKIHGIFFPSKKHVKYTHVKHTRW